MLTMVVSHHFLIVRIWHWPLSLIFAGKHCHAFSIASPIWKFFTWRRFVGDKYIFILMVFVTKSLILVTRYIPTGKIVKIRNVICVIDKGLIQGMLIGLNQRMCHGVYCCVFFAIENMRGENNKCWRSLLAFLHCGRIFVKQFLAFQGVPRLVKFSRQIFVNFNWLFD